MVLLLRKLATLEAELSHLWQLADGFGLLEEARPQRQLQVTMSPKSSKLLVAMTLVRLVAFLCSAYYFCQYLVRYGPGVAHRTPRWALQLLVVKALPDQTWSHALGLSAPYAVLLLLCGHDLLFLRQRPRKLALSQVLYERRFGVHGSDYVLKVAVLQVATVLLQACGKLRLLAGVVTFALQQQVAALPALKVAFWAFWSLLAWNSLYPSVLFVFPTARWARYGSAVMDVLLDLGYMLTYLLLVDARVDVVVGLLKATIGP